MTEVKDSPTTVDVLSWFGRTALELLALGLALSAYIEHSDEGWPVREEEVEEFLFGGGGAGGEDLGQYRVQMCE